MCGGLYANFENGTLGFDFTAVRDSIDMPAEQPAKRPGKWIDRYVDRLHILLIAGGVSLVSVSLALAIHLQTPEHVEGGPISDTATLVVYEKDDCEPCEAFRAEGGRAYRSSTMQSKAPLIYRSAEGSAKPGSYRLKSAVQDVDGPVAVLFDRHGREVTRFVGASCKAQYLESSVAGYIRRALR